MWEGAIVDALGDAVASSRAMKDPTEESLNGGASTNRWSCTPPRGPAAVLSLSLIRSHLALVAAQKREEGVERMNARVSGDGVGTNFDLPGSTRNRSMGMDRR
jgi:hypothetical protein